MFFILILKDPYPAYFPTIPILPTADYLGQVRSVNQKLEDCNLLCPSHSTFVWDGIFQLQPNTPDLGNK